MGTDPSSPLYGKAYQTLMIVSALSWITQFLGHGVFEKRAPALLKNVLFANIAPFFVTFEWLHALFGYRSGEIVELNKEVEADIAHYRLQNDYSQRSNVVVDSVHKKSK